MNNTPELHDINEVAARTRKSVSWLYRNYRRFDHTRLGKSLYWTDEQIAGIIAGSAVQGVPAAPPAPRATSPRKETPGAKPVRGSGLSGFVSRPESSRRLRRENVA